MAYFLIPLGYWSEDGREETYKLHSSPRLAIPLTASAANPHFPLFLEASIR